MIIQSSQITMSSQHLLVQQESINESLQVWHQADKKAEAEKAAAGIPLRGDKVSLSEEASAPRPHHKHGEEHGLKIGQGHKSGRAHEIEKSDNPEDDLKHGWKLQLLRRLVEQLTGRKIKFAKASDFAPSAEESEQTPPADQADTPPPAAEDEPLGWGLAYHYQHSYTESEQTSFNATGVVSTADGQQIALNLQLNMSRSFASNESLDIRAGDALKDPLVIKYAGSAAQLQATDLQFDIDLDGSPDQLNFVAPGSGFLALDKNGDGQINDGSELFGPASGDGFAELATYDDDGNNWIDENDAVYSRLRIWSRDAEGQAQLFALGQQGIGAIYLDHAATPFALNDSQNQQLGQVQSSGVFLFESGRVGSIQQLDMVV